MKLLNLILVFSVQVCSYFKDPLVCIGTVAMEQIVSRFAVTTFFSITRNLFVDDDCRCREKESLNDANGFKFSIR